MLSYLLSLGFLVIPSESQLFLQALCDKEALPAPEGRQQQSQQYSLQHIYTSAAE